MIDFRWLRDLWLGRRAMGQITERVTAAVLAATTPIFTVSGGKILVTSIVGTITTVIQALPTNLRLSATPTLGTAAFLCANLAIASYAAGDILGITGVPTDPMLPAATSGAIPGMTMPVVVQAGVINYIADAAPTGAIRWTLHWIPLDPTASVAAA